GNRPDPAALLEAQRPFRRGGHGAARAAERHDRLVLPGTGARHARGWADAHAGIPAVPALVPDPGAGGAVSAHPASHGAAGTERTAAGAVLAQAGGPAPATGHSGRLEQALVRRPAGKLTANPLK